MKVLIACEFSGAVRDAFRARWPDAYVLSCDLRPSLQPGPHYQGDVRELLGIKWDLMIAHPPCRYLAISGNRWMEDPQRQQCRREALDFVRLLMDAPIPHIAIENPVSVISSAVRKPDLCFRQNWFGHAEQRRTCLWLKNLPPLRYTDCVKATEQKVWLAPDSKGRSERRSITLPGVAAAMADQWGEFVRDSIQGLAAPSASAGVRKFG